MRFFLVHFLKIWNMALWGCIRNTLTQKCSIFWSTKRNASKYSFWSVFEYCSVFEYWFASPWQHQNIKSMCQISQVCAKYQKYVPNIKSNLWFSLAPKPNGNNSQNSGCSQLSPVNCQLVSIKSFNQFWFISSSEVSITTQLIHT